MKATYGEVNGVGQEMFKDPITDDGTKRSKKGLLSVQNVDGTLVCFDQQTWEQEATGELRTVFLDGCLTQFQSLSQIRERLWSSQAVAA